MSSFEPLGDAAGVGSVLVRQDDRVSIRRHFDDEVAAADLPGQDQARLSPHLVHGGACQPAGVADGEEDGESEAPKMSALRTSSASTAGRSMTLRKFTGGSELDFCADGLGEGWRAASAIEAASRMPAGSSPSLPRWRRPSGSGHPCRAEQRGSRGNLPAHAQVIEGDRQRRREKIGRVQELLEHRPVRQVHVLAGPLDSGRVHLLR